MKGSQTTRFISIHLTLVEIFHLSQLYSFLIILEYSFNESCSMQPLLCNSEAWREHGTPTVLVNK